ncbi:MAG: hypothetical protein JRJ85_13045 [Deltaproteobacteria bacterium]|nr:hypothetical protein [Deltaproteobacteria bacterium]
MGSETKKLSVEVQVDWLYGDFLEGRRLPVQEVLSVVEKAGKELALFKADQLVDAFEVFSESLLTRSNPLLGKYAGSGIPFLGRWCGKENLTNILGDALGSIECLDRFVSMSFNVDRSARAFPKGLIIHWMAGNVPTLGLLSLVSGILTKNANIVRIPSLSDNLLADLMNHLSGLGGVPGVMARSVAIIRYDYRDSEAAEEVSRSADVRIIWGGDESSASIKRLPTKLTCMDMVFPDRTSFVVLGRSALSRERMDAVARLIAHDASVFEQKACASPHTVLLSTDDEKTIQFFCRSLKSAMHRILKLIPKTTPLQKEVQAILNLRAQYDMFHEAWYSKGTEFSIFWDDKIQIGPPIGNRTIFVRSLPSVDELATILPSNVQSVGIAADGDEYERLTNLLGAAGVHRFTPLGAMTHFDIPWDGVVMPQLLVRWTTRQIVKNG